MHTCTNTQYKHTHSHTPLDWDHHWPLYVSYMVDSSRNARFAAHMHSPGWPHVRPNRQCICATSGESAQTITPPACARGYLLPMPYWCCHRCAAHSIWLGLARTIYRNFGRYTWCIYRIFGREKPDLQSCRLCVQVYTICGSGQPCISVYQHQQLCVRFKVRVRAITLSACGRSRLLPVPYWCCHCCVTHSI